MFIIQITTAEDEKFFVSEKKGKLAATDKVCLETKLFRSEREAEVFAINHLKLGEKIIAWDIKSTADPDLPGAVALSEPVYLIKVFSDTKGKKYHVGYLHYNTTTESYFFRAGQIGACAWKIESVKGVIEAFKRDYPDKDFMAIELLPKMAAK